jgi:epoxyqueuosine reductase QueG
MKDHITKLIREFTRVYGKHHTVSTDWGEPVVGFADAGHPYILSLKNVISPSHGLPCEVMEDASIVIAYFIPFTKELARKSRIRGDLAAPEWALAYEETNAMIRSLNEYLIEALSGMGYKACVSPLASTFDRRALISSWSHRHFAYAAGLGTFGLNNMLITKRGCCGRFGTLVTNLDVSPDAPQAKESCRYKKNGSCGVCIKFCPSGALTTEGFDREKCYAVCLKNADVYTGFGCSYTDETGTKPNSKGSDVCGKCVVYAPCAFADN